MFRRASLSVDLWHRRVTDSGLLSPERDNQTRKFLILYALAWAGGAVSYVPFLTILLPVRVTDLAGIEDLDWLAYIAFTGAIAASVGNIFFGWLSDVTKTRRLWIALGLVLSCLLLVTVPVAKALIPLIGIIVIWQLSLNMMLGPLAAWAGDCVPDHQKGILGGLMSFAPALGALAGWFVTLPGIAGPDGRLWLVAGLVAAAILPILVLGKPKPFAALTTPLEALGQVTALQTIREPMVQRMWLARLLVQIAEAALFAFLYFWLRSIAPDFGDNRTAGLFMVVLAASIPIALFAGRWADRTERPIQPLALFALITAAGLLWMGFAASLSFAIIGYVIFGIAGTAFLALHSAQTLRVLPKPQNRGRDLGIFNLTNTIPSLIMPWLTLGLVPIFGFSGLFFLLAGLAAVASALLFSISR